MFKKLKDKFLCRTIFGFDNEKTNQQFMKWRRDHSYTQITYLAAVTATMYVLLATINIYISPKEMLPDAVILEMFVIAPMLYFISYISYRKKDFLYVELMLFISPIVAASLHLYIISKLEVYNSYQVELYLMIIWIYTLSGMSYYHAIVSSTIIYILGISLPYTMYSDQMHPFILHTMWMSISMIFGLFGAYLIKKSQKENFIKQLELEKMAIEDKLTGLYNRTKLDEVLTHELQRASRYKESIGLFIIDIDYFKSVNDMYGHLVGDQVIIDISKLIKNNLRSTDTLFRWGGEEFIVLSLETHKEEAMTIAHKINNYIKEAEFDLVGHKTVSIGVTTNNEDDDVTSIIKRADEALYLAKNSGRDCVKYI
ncbi:GGDEF domain-containing protein [Sulfurimonas sp.]|uniref:GGDEF domain-containing protein n=1 Tax=Sulfurimonas sp. TaxID=2022749 RepID=UPI003561B168